MKTKEQIDKMPLDKYIFWLNSMTTAELHKEFPGEFNKLKAGDSQGETVKNMLANDAILWRFVKTHAQKLASELTEKESEVRTAGEVLRPYIVSAKSDNYQYEFICVENAITATHEFASQLQQPEKEQPSDDRKIATPKVIFERLKLMYNNGDTQCRAFVAEICDEILDKTGGLLGDIRDSQFPQEIKSK